MNTRGAIAGLVLLLLLGGAVFAYQLIDTDAPDAVSTASALEQLETETATADTDSTDGAVTTTIAAAVDPGVEGTWSVDDEFGDFGFSNASGSFAGFRVDKTFLAGRGVTAVGRTGSVSGTVVIGANELSSAEIIVDMTQMESDERSREKAILETIKASEFPTATFSVTSPTAIDTDQLDAGQTITADVAGTLDIAGVVNDVVIPIEATIVEPGFGLVVGSLDLVWADYGVETPSSAGATVADEGILEFQLVVRFTSN